MHAALALADTAANVTAGATVGLAVLALVALVSLVDARKTRHGHIVADLSRRWDDEHILKSVQRGREFDSARKIELIQRLWGLEEQREQDPTVWLELYEVWLALSVWPNLIETIGVFVEKGIISDDIAYDMWGPQIISACREWDAPIQELRRATKDRDREVWRFFDEAGTAMRRVEADRRPPFED
jgi:hypothetical protein